VNSLSEKRNIFDNMNKTIFWILLFSATSIFAQEGETIDSTLVIDEETYDEESIETFHSTRIINSHSVETLNKGVLEFRVEHRFGDIAGDNGGAQTLFGLDNSADIRIAFEYGITDQLMIGVGRSKGTGNPYKSLIDGLVKYRVLEQNNEGTPISLAMIGMGTFSYMKASEDESQVAHFPEWEHRLAYALQLNVARKFGDRLSLALMPTLVHRNYVLQDDVNTMFSLGGGLRLGLTSTTAVLLEYHHVFSKEGLRTTNTNSLGVAFEWITFGHNFTVHLTNSKGFGETQFIPYTYEDWLKGQFRLGFCIGRKFSKG
jgi:hypothetical protein